MGTGDKADAAPHGEAKAGARAWYTLGVLTVIYMLHSVDRSVMSIVIEPLKHEFKLSDSQIGLLTGLGYSLTYAIAAAPIGYMIDRTNRRNLLAGLLTIWSGCTALCGIASSYATLLAARLAVGAAEAGGAPTAMAMVGDMFPARRRSMAISIFWTSTAMGTAASFILGSIIAKEHGWRATFLMAGAPGLLLAALLFFTVREPPRVAASGGGAPSLLATWNHVRRQPLFVHTIIAMTLNAVMLSGVIIWLASFLIRVHHLELTRAGLIAGLVAGLCGGVGSLIGGPLGDYAYRKGGIALLPLAPALTTLATVIAGVVFALSGHLYLALAGVIVFEVLGRSYTAPGYNLILSSVEPQMRGVCAAAQQIAANLIGYGLGPLLVGWVSDHAPGAQPLRYGLLSVMAVGLWAALHFYLAYRSALKKPLAVEDVVAA